MTNHYKKVNKEFTNEEPQVTNKNDDYIEPKEEEILNLDLSSTMPVISLKL